MGYMYSKHVELFLITGDFKIILCTFITIANGKAWLNKSLTFKLLEFNVLSMASVNSLITLSCVFFKVLKQSVPIIVSKSYNSTKLSCVGIVST